MKVERVYWDSDAFLAWFQVEPGKVEKCAGTIERAKAGEVFIYTSALTIVEVLWMRGAPRIQQDKAAIVRKFFRRSYFRVRNVTRSIAESAQDLVWNHSIGSKDAIHVATALDAQVPILETFDGDLLRKSGRIGTSGLVIRQPLPPSQPPLGPELT